MKKAYNSKRNYLFFLGLLCICLFSFNLSCGLDTVDAVLEDPFYELNIPNEESNYDNCYFSFSTAKLSNSNSFGKGYVYYKIYNKRTTKNSEVNRIDTMINDSSSRYNAATTLINSYNYKELYYVKALGDNPSTLVLDNVPQNIRIRLTNYGSSTGDFSAKIFIGDTLQGIPVRNNGKTFDFGRNGTYDEKPVKMENDENASDTKGFSDEVTSEFFVVLYGVFAMPTESFEKIIYSPVHYLGEVRIDANTENN